MKTGQTRTVNFFLALVCLASVFLIPDLKIKAGWPAFQLVDFTLIFISIKLFVERKTLQWSVYYTFLCVFMLYILFTILLNWNLNAYNDFFEIYKMLKLVLIIIWATTIDYKTDLKPLIKPFFIILAAINLMHFFELPYVNEIIYKYYPGDLNIKYFGKNSLGLPASKRMTGLSANPNNNALLFTLFAIYFFPHFKQEKSYVWSIIALLLVFLCQSKTSFIFLFILIAWIIISKELKLNIKQWLYLALVVGGSYGLAFALCSRGYEVETYSNVAFSNQVLETGSTQGRIQIWKELSKMIIEKPIFGYGPYKNYFYDNRLFSENEYILILWRYGLIGVIAYLLVFIIPIYLLVKNKIKNKGLLIAIMILFLTSALTNNPLSEQNIIILFALIVGIFLKKVNLKQRLN